MGCFGKKPKHHRCTIVLLDETDIVHEIQDRTRGEDLLQAVYTHLNLLETAYFGLRYMEKTGETRWLEPLKKVTKQLKGTSQYTFYFGVKFYASDPCKLLEEITRYQFVLQVKQDILQGRLPVTFDLSAELFALSLQSELGDYDSRRHNTRYVSEFRFLPNQTTEVEDKVVDIHKSLIGQVPSSVEMTFLERVKWLDMYGVDLHVVMGEDNVEYFLCLTPSGVVVMKNKVKISNYFWPRITKAFFKGKYFMLRVRDKANDENTYVFELPSKQACKYLWKCCVEHHAFFRLTQVKELPGLPINIFSLGSKHRYSGRTEQQIKMDMKQIKRPPPTVVRVPSRRYPKRLGEPDGADADVDDKKLSKRIIISNAKDDSSLPQPVSSSPLYRSISTPAELSAVDSSKGNSSAPWEDPNQRGLFSNSSHQSLQSSHNSGRKHSSRSHSRRRSSSIDSENSVEYRRRRHHKSKKSSDNDSDISKSSRGSRGSKSSRASSSHRKTRNHNRDTGSDSDSYQKRRGRRHSSRRSGSKYDLIESDPQWKLVQKQQEKNYIRPQNAVVRDLSNKKSGYMNSGIDTESEITTHHRRKHRRHSRSRSRSPDPKHSITSEIKKHIEYNLIDAAGLTEEEKKDIKYTKIETEKDVFKIRYSPSSGKPKYKMAKVPSRTSLDRLHTRKPAEEDPPPPYTPLLTNRNASQDSLKKNSWEYEGKAKSTASYSTAHISDSSSGSVSSALKSRYTNGNIRSANKEELSNLARQNSQNLLQDSGDVRKQSTKQKIIENNQLKSMQTRNNYEMCTEL